MPRSWCWPVPVSHGRSAMLKMEQTSPIDTIAAKDDFSNAPSNLDEATASDSEQVRDETLH